MVYYSSSLGKIRFNRNILYCKALYSNRKKLYNPNLIETFCIVKETRNAENPDTYDLIETFCIVKFRDKLDRLKVTDI